MLHRTGARQIEVDGRRFVLDDDFDLISDARETLTTILVHDDGLMARDRSRIGVDDEKWRLVSAAVVNDLVAPTVV